MNREIKKMKHNQLVLCTSVSLRTKQGFLENVKGKEITILLYLSELGRGPRSFFSSYFIS